MLKIPSFLFGIIAIISSSIILFSANSPSISVFMLKILNTIITQMKIITHPQFYMNSKI